VACQGEDNGFGAASWLTGRVLHEGMPQADGAAMPLAGVSVLDLAGGAAAFTDATGRFFLPVRRRGLVELFIQKPGFDRTVTTVLAIGARQPVADIRLVPFKALSAAVNGATRVYSSTSSTVEVHALHADTPVGLAIEVAEWNRDQFPQFSRNTTHFVAGFSLSSSLTTPMPGGTKIVLNEAWGLPIGTSVPVARLVLGRRELIPAGAASVVSSGGEPTIEFGAVDMGTYVLALAAVPLGNEGEPSPVRDRSTRRGFGAGTRLSPWATLADGRYMRSVAVPPPMATPDSDVPIFVYNSSAAQGLTVLTPGVYFGQVPTPSPSKTRLTWRWLGHAGEISIPELTASTEFPLVLTGTDAFGPPSPTATHPLQWTLHREWPGTFANSGAFGGPPAASLAVPTRFPNVIRTSHDGVATRVNDRQSPFGIGWWLGGVPRLYADPSEKARYLQVIDGHGELTSRKGLVTDMGGAAVPQPLGSMKHISAVYLGGAKSLSVFGEELLLTSWLPDDPMSGVVALVPSTGVVQVLAGGGMTGPNGDIGDGGPATLANLAQPAAVVRHPRRAGFYIADTGHHRIRYVDESGTISTVAGDGSAGHAGDGGPAGLATLSAPHGMAMAGGGSLWFCDTGNHAIRKISMDGVMSTVLLSSPDVSPPTLNGPKAVAFDAAGNTFLADTGNARILRIDVAGGVTHVAGTGTPGAPGPGAFANVSAIPALSHLTVSSAGEVHFADPSSGLIWRIGDDGRFHVVAGGGQGGYGSALLDADLGKPSAIALTRRGDRAFVLAKLGRAPEAQRSVAVVHLDDLSALDSSLVVKLLANGKRQTVAASGEQTTFVLKAGHYVPEEVRRPTGALRAIYQWDAQARPQSVQFYPGGTYPFSYQSNHVMVDAPDGHRTKLALDAAHRLAAVVQSDGAASAWVYDDGDRIVSDRDMRGGSVSINWRSDGMLQSWQSQYEYSTEEAGPACMPVGSFAPSCLVAGATCNQSAGPCGSLCGTSICTEGGICASLNSSASGDCAPPKPPAPTSSCSTPPCTAPPCSGGSDIAVCASGAAKCESCCCVGADCTTWKTGLAGCSCQSDSDCDDKNPATIGMCQGGSTSAETGLDSTDSSGKKCEYTATVGACAITADCAKLGPCYKCDTTTSQCVKKDVGVACGSTLGDVCLCTDFVGKCDAAAHCVAANFHDSTSGVATFLHRDDGQYDYCAKKDGQTTCTLVQESNRLDRLTQVAGATILLDCSASSGDCKPVETSQILTTTSATHAATVCGTIKGPPVWSLLCKNPAAEPLSGPIPDLLTFPNATVHS